MDFQNQSIRVWETVSRRERGRPKSRKSRTVPMVAEVAQSLRALRQRDVHIDAKDPVFANEHGDPMDGSALQRRYVDDLKSAGLLYLRFHDLRHTFGSLAMNTASIVQVQAWMGRGRQDDHALPAPQEPRKRARLLLSAFGRDAAENVGEAA